MILAAWFYILLLILREFRKFALAVSGRRTDLQGQNPLIDLCKESVERASQFSEQHSKTLSELVQVQIALEAQLAQIRTSTADHITKEEQASINDLNKKLSRSHKLIKKLKGDLDTSVKKLKVAKHELNIQTSSFEELQDNNEKLQNEVEALRAQKDEWINAPMSPVPKSDSEMAMMLNNYKRQIDEQNQLIDQLSLESNTDGNAEQVIALQKELEQAKHKIKHLYKEKKFVESRYLEMVKAKGD